MLNIKQMGPKPQSVTILSIMTFLFSVVAIAIIGLLIFSENEPIKSFWRRGDFFWIKLIWCEVIFCVLWFFSLQSPFINLLGQRQQTGGAIPAISSAILIACIWSYVILLISIFLPNGRLYNIFPVIAQIILFVMCFWKVMILNQARYLQNDGIIPIPPDIKQPESLITQLSIREKKVALTNMLLAKQIKSIYERINYSLPRVGKIATSDRYVSLGHDIDLFCNHLDVGYEAKEINLELEKIDRELMLLIAELK